MPAFAAIAQYYHLLFPARPAQLGFLTALAGPPPARVFDVASGTAEYTAALCALGYDCYGVDLDPAMHARAKERHPELTQRGRLIQGDMLELTDLVRGPARLAFCIGGSVAHLVDDASLREAILQMWELTRPGGVVALQVVNYDRITREGGRDGALAHSATLPTLRAKTERGEDVVLERRYDLRGLPERVLFKKRLVHPGGVDEGATPLLCLFRERLAAALPAAAQVAWQGGFTGSPWDAQAQATVCVLR
jgi:SAM-dependent methyltransferase